MGFLRYVFAIIINEIFYNKEEWLMNIYLQLDMSTQFGSRVIQTPERSMSLQVTVIKFILVIAFYDRKAIEVVWFVRVIVQ